LRVLSSSARNVQQKRAKFSTSLIFLSTGCGFFRAGGNDWKRQGRGFRPPRSNRLESRCFEGRNGPKPVVARDSNEIERRRVRAICLAASEQRAVAARRASWARMRSSTTSCGCFIWAVSGRSCPSIRIIMGAPQFTTRASIAPSSGGRRTDAWMPFSRARSSDFARTRDWTRASFMAMAPRAQRKREATTSASAATKRSRAARSLPSANGIAT
jgi:hypothetical protein